MAEEIKNGTYALNSFDGAENDPNYLLVVKNLKKYFPIKSSFLKKTIGNVKAVDGISFKIKTDINMAKNGESLFSIFASAIRIWSTAQKLHTIPTVPNTHLKRSVGRFLRPMSKL